MKFKISETVLLYIPYIYIGKKGQWNWKRDFYYITFEDVG